MVAEHGQRHWKTTHLPHRTCTSLLIDVLGTRMLSRRLTTRSEDADATAAVSYGELSPSMSRDDVTVDDGEDKGKLQALPPPGHALSWRHVHPAQVRDLPLVFVFLSPS